ncbi:DUF3857 domain-containing protein [Dysgonomonas sp. 25]|uniref:DUF3857 domain-containing protein n=1 Tax=Dysgonomonas sp. 25 TaxID=2302933 RepID=UPI0013D5B716|nr:DUF3857 domain-containing protein [Dysgonomonas sp. 25]NDV70349.1 DUF3857 domain-containing protein [Dysgonomonas sp. 25]
MKKYLLLLIICVPSLVFSQRKYAAGDIPDSLKVNAVSVVRDYSLSFVQTNANTGTYKLKRVLTILNKQGDRRAHFNITCDRFRELLKFSGTLRDAEGNIIKKIKRGDLKHSSFDSQSLASDDFALYYECQSPSYPFTIEYEYEAKFKNGIVSYPPFIPQDRYRQSVENAVYEIELPADLKLRTKANYDLDLQKREAEKGIIYSTTFNGKAALAYEVMSPPDEDILPYALFAPAAFCFDSYCGDMSDWKGMGSWQNQLLKGRDVLPDNWQQKVRELTEGLSSDREKVKALYEYLQQNTRYVSIQLGIGGWQPIEASKVAKTGFGDCKGLTNLMMAMLKAANIPSHYASIYLGNERSYLYEDYPSFGQMNHVVLLVPLKNDSIWLECTSAKEPFGFVHRQIAGHDALVMTPEGGKVCRLPVYPNADRLQAINMQVELKEDYSLSGNIEITEHLDHAVRLADLIGAERKEQTSYVTAYLKMANMQLGNIDISYHKSEKPVATLKTAFDASDVVNKTGNRIFVTVSPLNRGNYKIFSASERNRDIYVQSGFVDKDTIIYTLPEGMTPESLPKDISLKTQFGSFDTKTSIDGNKVIYTQHIELLPGQYDKSSYQEIKGFFSQIDTALKRKMVIKKN